MIAKLYGNPSLQAALTASYHVGSFNFITGISIFVIPPVILFLVTGLGVLLNKNWFPKFLIPSTALMYIFVSFGLTSLLGFSKSVSNETSMEIVRFLVGVINIISSHSLLHMKKLRKEKDQT